MTCPNCGGRVTRDVESTSSGTVTTVEVFVCVGTAGEDVECGWRDSREVETKRRTA